MRITILGMPMDLGSGRRGVDMGPSAIRIAGLSEKLKSIGHIVTDEGDILIKAPEQQRVKDDKLKYLNEIVRGCNLLSNRIERILSIKSFPLILGGDHSIAIGTLAGICNFNKRQNKTVGLIWFDAHGDLNTADTTPSGNIHGMPLAACLGQGSKYLTSVGGEFQKIHPKNVVMIGIRELDEGEKKLIKKLGITIFTMEDIDKEGMGSIVKKSLKKLKHVDHLHVSLDLDALDPTFAPGVGTPVKGGLDYREAHLFMESLFDSGKLSSLEVVEENPILDIKNQTAELAVDLILSSFGKKII
ncbi:MAG: arginase [Ignavibacteria bacterium]|nr:arginase [Bacteroidota bacterium]MSQ45480.1 arginase [Ignavibacteria bacterium]